MQHYINSHANDIRNYTQQAFDLELCRSNGQFRNSIIQALRNPDFATELYNIPNPINRKDVIDCFNHSMYRGFIATLLWGGKHKEHYGSFQKIITTYSKNEIEEKLERTCALLQAQNTQGAFDSFLKEGKCNIQHIGESYFTKLIYFLSYIATHDYRPRPLILDNVLQQVRCAFMIEDGLDYYNYYTYNHQSHHLFILKNNYTSDAYVNFCNRMNEAAETIDATPEKLEAFLFCNCPMPDGTVPRQYVNHFIDSHFHN